MMGKISISLRKSAWLLAVLIITSALPARAADADEIEFQEAQFNFTLSDDLNGYIISPNKYSYFNWDSNEVQMLEVPATCLRDGLPVVGLSGFGSLEYLEIIYFPDNCQLKYISDKCFYLCSSLGVNEAIILPETVETIGEYAFHGCEYIHNINLGSSLKSIGRYAFDKCTSLQSITLPKSLKILREYAFKDCTALESVVFEDGVDFYATNGVFCFYDHVFWGCTNLSSVTLPNNTPGYFCIPQGTFGYCSNLKSIEFPANTRKIEQLAFYRSGLESLDFTTIESDLLYLSGYYTFAACENLTTITAKGKVHFDGLYTFQDCKALETATFTGSGEDYTIMNPDIFKYCDNLKSVEFYHLKGNGQSNDMDSVFTGCTSLERVTSTRTPEISKIGYSCFDGCTSLTTLSLPDKEFAVNETAFRNCAALESFDFTNVTSLGKASFSGCTALASTPNISKLTTITENAFQGCTSLKSLEFTDLTSIGPNAFNGCTALESFSFNSTSEEAITATIGTQAFTGCTALATINFNSSSYNPPTVENEDAFDESHYAGTEVNMPENRFGDFVADEIWKKFAGLNHPAMYAYTSVSGGYSITKGEYAFADDFTNMLEIPEQYNSSDVVAIDTFQDLTGLTGVTLPEKIASIGANAFSGCTGITTVINKATEPITGDACLESAFESDVYSGGTLYVPFGSLDAYSSTAPWSNFTEKKQGLGERTLDVPTASPEQGEFNQAFDLTLTNPNGEEAGATIYYYIVKEGDEANAVRTVETYSAPFKISSTCTVVAYVSNGTQCSEPVSWTFTRQYVSTENGLDKVLAATTAGEEYIINTPLYGHYFDGTYLYASTMGNSGSSKTTPTEEQIANESSDIAENFNREDWVAIEGLTSSFVGKAIESGSVATVGINPAYPVITFNEDVSYGSSTMGINTFRVENFNASASDDIWLVAPQPAEYCTVRGYLTAANIHATEGYLVLQSAEPATNESTEGSTTESTEGSTTESTEGTTNENETTTAPLTMNVYYTPGALTLGEDGWYSFIGIVSKNGEDLKFTALFEGTKETVKTNAELLSMKAGKLYEVNVNLLEGVKVNGGVLYARTTDVSAAPSEPAEDHKGFDSYEDGYKLDKYDQRDWVAIEGLTSEYVGFGIGSFTASYDGVKLTPMGEKPAVGNEAATMDINTFAVANVFYGNYENMDETWTSQTNGYKPFFVKAKVNEVAYYVGEVKAATGGFELWGSGACGKLNEQGLAIDANGIDIAASTAYQQIEGVLVADAEANGGVKLVALATPTTPTGVETLKADGKATIYGTEGAVVVTGADGKVMIFDAMGRMVKIVDAEGAATVELPAGYYIVRTAGAAAKVIVK